MAVKIRLQRGGSTHTPHYRIVVAESRFRRDGRFIEVIGRYNPVAKRHSDKCTLELDRADHWLSVGAQPTGTVKGLINRFRRGFYESSEEEQNTVVETPTPAPKTEPEPVQKKQVAEEVATEISDEKPEAVAENDSSEEKVASIEEQEANEESKAGS
jgi:small subunit ribosomal protein S16